MQRRYLAITTFILLAVAGVLLAQQRGPKALVGEPRFEMGYMPQMCKVAHTFWVNNIGTDSLRIRNVNVSCGCTKATNPTKPVAVNDSVPIEIVFDAGTRKKAQNKTVTVSSNDPVSSSLELAFTCYVYEPSEDVGPVKITRNEKLDIKNTDLGKSYTISFLNKTKTSLTPKAIIWPKELLTLEMPKSATAPGATGQFVVKFMPSLPEKNYVKSFTIEFDDAAKTRYTIPVRISESLSSAKANVQKGS